MFVAVVAALNPLLGEEGEFVGLTFQELQATNPRLADNVWHLNVGVSSLAFGASLLVVLLAWRGLSGGSRLAWYSILFLNLTFAAAVVAAHVPIYIRYGSSFDHWFLPATLTLVQLVGLAVTAKPVFSRQQEE